MIRSSLAPVLCILSAAQRKKRVMQSETHVDSAEVPAQD